MECSSKQIDGDTNQNYIFTAKWYIGGPITEIKRHVDKKHPAGAEPASKRARGPSGSLMDRFFTARGEAAGDSRSKTIQNKKEKLDADIHKYKQPPVLEEREDPLHFCVDGTCLFRR